MPKCGMRTEREGAQRDFARGKNPSRLFSTAKVADFNRATPLKRNSVLTQISTKRHQMMNSGTTALAAATAFLVALAPAAAQTPTIGTYLSAAKSAAGTDWAGTFLRLCIPAPAPPATTAPRA